MRLANLDGRLTFLVGDGAIDVAAASGGILSFEPAAAFGQWNELLALATHLDAADAQPYDRALLRSPVERPRQIFAVALNYRPHAAEAGFTAPESPLIFTKFASSLTGAFAEVEVPEGHVDWELELVAVIGADTYRVPVDEGWDAVAAVSVGQDISERLTQSAGTPAQFSLGKSFPGFGPVGPALVSLDELPDRDDLELTTVLSGQTVQHDRTSSMIFSVPALVAFISAVCPLYAGDLIFTGTPAGVGNRMVPQRFIHPGDVLTSTIEGVGEMTTTFVSGA